jgi:hypothetical protein
MAGAGEGAGDGNGTCAEDAMNPRCQCTDMLILIEKMRMRIQEKISMWMRIQIRMRIHALTEL